MKLLIADDELTTRALLGRAARKWGYEVVEVVDGQAAWEELTSDDPPRIALLDWVMPNIEGVEICRRLVEQPPNVLIYTILLTSREEKDDLIYALDSGAHDYVIKPVHREELRSRVAVGRRLVDAHDKLLDLNRLKNKFLGMAAHDLRNPLISIRGLSETLVENDFIGSEEEKHEILVTINKAADQMISIVNDFLDVSMIESGTLDIRREEKSLKRVVERCIRLLEGQARRKDMEIHSNLEDIEPFGFDPKRVTQVVDNLLSNAVKYSPYGASIWVKLTRSGDFARISVIDQGQGLSEEDQARLFSDFQRLSSKPTGGEISTGLGLAICKKIVDAHGGKMEVRSKLGAGSAFGCVLPITPDAVIDHLGAVELEVHPACAGGGKQ
ncbi:MAG: ATP-binding protein [Desulfatibacillaceae bacterium]